MKGKRFLKCQMPAGILNRMALVSVTQSANQACMWFFHQPKFPESANRFKKH